MSRQRALQIPRSVGVASKQMPTSRVFVQSVLPNPAEVGLDSVVLYDRRLPEFDASFRRWIREFPASVGLRAGETLKDVGAFAPMVAKILRQARAIPGRRARGIVAVGGGSVGDFAGFFASIYHRGVPLTHISTTWLAALDSAHGGKTALNVGEAKNQLGTFHSAERIYIVESVLRAQPAQRANEAMGELVKMALIDGGSWVRELERSILTGGDLLWKFLPRAILAKYEVVRRDPFERSGIRAILNLGHTLGHVLELRHQIPHGSAVACGLHFTIDWSAKLDFLPEAEHARARRLLERHLAWDRIGLSRRPPPMARAIFMRLAMQDKKKASGGAIRFIFLKKIGEPIARDVSLDAFVAAARQTGWVR